jgi:mono/diheme cytochrome c family protein
VRQAFYLGAVLAAMLVPVAAQNKAITKQAERGKELFLKSPKGIACGTCHTMAGVGTEVGPDLRTLASVVPPRGLVAAIQMTMTERVQEVKTGAESFPGLLKEKKGEEIEIWQLDKTPPVLRKFASKDVESMTRTEKWKHPPATTEYTSQELADIIGFLKWAAIGQTKEVKVADVE